MLGYVAENLISGLIQSVQWSDVENLQNDDWSVVDVRSAGEFTNGTIPGAINISVDEMREKIADVPTGKIIVTCQVGQRGHVATTLLRKLGYEAVNLDGGYRTWKNSPAFKNTKE
jgi:rhodanese-related sulfurtransferase